MRVTAVFIIVWSLTVMSCDYFKPKKQPEAIARVNDSYLYADDIRNLVPEGTSVEDSILIVKSFIDGWATRQLLIDAAEINLSIEKQEEFKRLVRQFKEDLYTKAYLEEVVKTTVDTVISESDIKSYYEENKSNLRTTGALVRLRYIHLPTDHAKLEVIKKKFFDGSKTDAAFWESHQLQFKSFALNDSVWVEMNQIYRKLPFITPDNRDDYIVSGRNTEKKDSLDVYLVSVKRVIEKNEIGPYEYLKPTIRQVLLNQRKLELIKKFEKDITSDAIKNKTYEIY